jgi:hypothetical protein
MGWPLRFVAHLQKRNKVSHRRRWLWPIPAITDGEAVGGCAKKIGGVEGSPICAIVRQETHWRGAWAGDGSRVDLRIGGRSKERQWLGPERSMRCPKAWWSLGTSHQGRETAGVVRRRETHSRRCRRQRLALCGSLRWLLERGIARHENGAARWRGGGARGSCKGCSSQQLVSDGRGEEYSATDGVGARKEKKVAFAWSWERIRAAMLSAWRRTWAENLLSKSNGRVEVETSYGRANTSCGTLEWLPGGGGPRAGLDYGLVLLHWVGPIPRLKFPFQNFPNNSKCLNFKNAKHYFLMSKIF